MHILGEIRFAKSAEREAGKFGRLDVKPLADGAGREIPVASYLKMNKFVTGPTGYFIKDGLTTRRGSSANGIADLCAEISLTYQVLLQVMLTFDN